MRLLGILNAPAVLCGLAVLSSLVYWWWRPEELFLVLLGVLAVRFVVKGCSSGWLPRSSRTSLSSRTVNNFSIDRLWPKPEHRHAWEVIAQVPASVAVSAQDRYVAHLSLGPLVFVFPEEIEKADHLLLNASSYPWPTNPGVTMQRDEDTVTITNGAGGATYRYRVAAEKGPHLLLRRL